jgi:hypothetical protein
VITLGVNRPQRTAPRRIRPNFNLVLRICEAIAEFMEATEAHGCKAYIAFGDGRACLYLATQKEVYDFELSDKLADFVSPYIKDGLLTSAVLLPASTPEELTAYFNPKQAIRIEVEKVEESPLF